MRWLHNSMAIAAVMCVAGCVGDRNRDVGAPVQEAQPAAVGGRPRDPELVQASWRRRLAR